MKQINLSKSLIFDFSGVFQQKNLGYDVGNLKRE